MPTVESGRHSRAQDEHRRGRPVVGALAAVLFDAASEFGEHHHSDVLGAADPLEVLHEGADCVRGVHQQSGVDIGLVDVRVERVALVADVVEPRRHARGDEGSHLLEVAAERVADAVIDARLVAGRGSPHEIGASGRVLGGCRQKSERRIRRGLRAAERGQHLLLLLAAFAAEAARIVEYERRVTTASHGERLAVADVDDHIVGRRIVAFIGKTTDPSERFAGVGHAGVPEAHRRKMRQARMVVPAAVHHGHQAVFVQPLEADHRRMKAKAVGRLDDVVFAYTEFRTSMVVGRIVIRHHGVQPVVPARQLDDHQNPLRMSFDARSRERLCGQGDRSPVQKTGQRRRQADAVQPALEKLPARTPAADVGTSKHGHLFVGARA